MSRSIYVLLTALMLGVSGCGNLPQVSTQTNNNTQAESSVSNRVSSSPVAPSAIVKNIQLRPSGFLIELDRNAVPLKQIVSSRQLTKDGFEYSFTLKNVAEQQGSTVNQQSGNQLIRSFNVQKQGTDLVITVQLEQFVDKVSIGAAGSFLGIALQDLPLQSMPVPHSVGRIPAWFFKDMLIAAASQGTPIQADIYGKTLPFEFSDKTYMLMAPFGLSQREIGFSAYFGEVPLYENYFSLLQTPSSQIATVTNVTYGRIRERERGKWIGVPAIMLNMPNSWALGFAHNQVIVEYEKAGVLTYTVYPVAGIELGAELRG